MPKGGSPESRLRLLWQPCKDLRNPALAAQLPPRYPRSLIHKLCELGKLDQRLEYLERHPQGMMIITNAWHVACGTGYRARRQLSFRSPCLSRLWKSLWNLSEQAWLEFAILSSLLASAIPEKLSSMTI